MKSQTTFGVEIEAYNLTHHEVVTALQGAQVDCYSSYRYNETSGSRWIVKTDSTISGNDPFELVSPILQGQEGLDEVRRAITAIEAAGAKVNRSCGMHVHYGIRQYNLKQIKAIAKRFVAYEDVIESFLPRSRRGTNNRWCQSNVMRFAGNTHAERVNNMLSGVNAARSVEQLHTYLTTGGYGYGGCRYHHLNLASYTRHGTMEFRLHSGTVDPEKVCNWIEFLDGLVHSAIEYPGVRKMKSDQKVSTRRSALLKLMFGGEYNTRPDLVEYYKARAKKLAA